MGKPSACPDLTVPGLGSREPAVPFDHFSGGGCPSKFSFFLLYHRLPHPVGSFGTAALFRISVSLLGGLVILLYVKFRLKKPPISSRNSIAPWHAILLVMVFLLPAPRDPWAWATPSSASTSARKAEGAIRCPPRWFWHPSVPVVSAYLEIQHPGGDQSRAWHSYRPFCKGFLPTAHSYALFNQVSLSD